MKKAVVFNIGCKTNQCECDALATALRELGYEVTEKLREADLYLVNTCAVTSEAERKSRQCLSRIRRLNPEAEIIVMGCGSEKDAAFYARHGASVFGVRERSKIPEFIASKKLPEVRAKEELLYEELPVAQGDRTRSYLKIHDGCNRFCSYCIIPYLRGRSRSRKIESAIAEAKEMAKRTPEIVITGINISDFGIDTGERLSDLVRQIGELGVRFRLGSLYVEGIDAPLIDALKAAPGFCPHFHLSLQHADDGVLKAMNRHDTTKEYGEKIHALRAAFGNAAITADVIVGYPTETEEAFRGMLDFLERERFADLHIFPFSPRPGTAAYRLKRLPKEIVQARVKEAERLRKALRISYLDKQIGEKEEVVWETRDEEGYLWGYSRTYVRCCAKGEEEQLHTATGFRPVCREDEYLKGEIEIW